MKPMIVLFFLALAVPSLVTAGGSKEQSGNGTSPQAGDVALQKSDRTGQGPVVLFFSADWCPTCLEANRDLDANGHKLGDIEVIRVNYDKEADLKTRYGITYQHTFVQIDPEGNEITKWNGGGVDAILKNVVRGER